MPKMKLKIKVHFYHLFMLSIVMLLCFYLVYRDMKRIENNVLGVYNRVETLEKMNNQISLKMGELIEARTYESQVNNIEQGETCLNMEEIVEMENGKYNEVNSVMKNVINLNQEVLNSTLETSVENLEEGVVEDVVEGVVEEVVEEGVVEDVVEDVVNTPDDGVLDLLNSIETEDAIVKDVVVEDVVVEDVVSNLSGMNREQLLERTNTELKNYLKSQNKTTAGNKNKLIETILESN